MVSTRLLGVEHPFSRRVFYLDHVETGGWGEDRTKPITLPKLGINRSKSLWEDLNMAEKLSIVVNVAGIVVAFVLFAKYAVMA